MITNRENLIYLSREVERVAVLRSQMFWPNEPWGDEEQKTTLAMGMALEGAHLAFGFGDDAKIAEAIRRLQEFKSLDDEVPL